MSVCLVLLPFSCSCRDSFLTFSRGDQSLPENVPLVQTEDSSQRHTLSLSVPGDVSATWLCPKGWPVIPMLEGSQVGPLTWPVRASVGTADTVGRHSAGDLKHPGASPPGEQVSFEGLHLSWSGAAPHLALEGLLCKQFGLCTRKRG